MTGGQNKFEGLIEVCQDGQWKTICGSRQAAEWDFREATVVCRQLRFAQVSGSGGKLATLTVILHNLYGATMGVIWHLPFRHNIASSVAQSCAHADPPFPQH